MTEEPKSGARPSEGPPPSGVEDKSFKVPAEKSTRDPAVSAPVGRMAFSPMTVLHIRRDGSSQLLSFDRVEQLHTLHDGAMMPIDPASVRDPLRRRRHS